MIYFLDAIAHTDGRLLITKRHKPGAVYGWVKPCRDETEADAVARFVRTNIPGEIVHFKCVAESEYIVETNGA